MGGWGGWNEKYRRLSSCPGFVRVLEGSFDTRGIQELYRTGCIGGNHRPAVGEAAACSRRQKFESGRDVTGSSGSGDGADRFVSGVHGHSFGGGLEGSFG